MFEKFGLLIDNEWRPAQSGKTMPVHSPATEEEIGTIPSADSADVALVLASAVRGFATWKAMAAWDRAKIMRKAAEILRERNEEIARVMSAETGKPLAEAKGEMNGTADLFEWYAEEAKRVYGQIIPARAADQRLSVVYQPVGVCLSLSAWNFPALLPSRKIAAALAAGCSIVARPASEAPGSCFKVAEALVDAGLPPGVVTVITGPSSKLAAELIAAPAIRKVSLTGSIAVGRKVLAQCAEGIKRASMELGGHAPVIVHRDADPRASAKAAAMAKFRNTGQVCISPTRFFVHESIRAPFEEAFVDYARSIVVGDGLKDGVTMGPMIRGNAVDAALELVQDAVDKGGRLLHGGRRPANLNKGHFLEPTVIADVPDDARIMVEEPFAPVAPLTTFVDEDEVIARANALPFGLASYVFSNDAGRAQRTADGIEAGMVGINEMLLSAAEIPFGGVKESGYGREGGSLGIKDYLEPKFIRHKLIAT
jgi:succinate-semialdehyde dehydrogenase/glutarate-semialdehyde dehydrogenase